jgi:hypothetical protein
MLLADLITLIAPESDEGLVAYVTSTAWQYLEGRTGARGGDPDKSRPERLVADPMYKAWVDRLMALIGAEGSTPYLRLQCCGRLADARVFLELNRRYSPSGLTGDLRQEADDELRRTCPSRGIHDYEACVLDWWVRVEPDALARWRAWHSSGEYLRPLKAWRSGL